MFLLNIRNFRTSKETRGNIENNLIIEKRELFLSYKVYKNYIKGLRDILEEKAFIEISATVKAQIQSYGTAIQRRAYFTI